jgi:CheY-like chemotaxis protein
VVIRKRLLEAMGGIICVQSELGCGSRFYFEVPFMVAPEPIEASSQTCRAPFKAPPCRLLVAEDVAIDREIMHAVLEGQGHHLTFAEDSAVALELARLGGWDVIVMNVQMPVMDGLEASRQIRLLPGAAGRVPIVGLTANVLTMGHEHYRAAGMDECLHKPIDWNLLDVALARFAPAPLAAVDKRIIANLRQAFGMKETQHLLEAGIQAYRGYCDAMEQDIAIPAAVARHAHKIKGSAGTLGLAALTQAAAVVEAAALVGEVSSTFADSLRALLAAAEMEIAAPV